MSNKYLTKIALNRFERFMSAVSPTRNFVHPSLGEAATNMQTVHKLKTQYGELAHPVIKDVLHKQRGTLGAGASTDFKNTGDSLKSGNFLSTVKKQKESLA